MSQSTVQSPVTPVDVSRLDAPDADGSIRSSAAEEPSPQRVSVDEYTTNAITFGGFGNGQGGLNVWTVTGFNEKEGRNGEKYTMQKVECVDSKDVHRYNNIPLPSLLGNPPELGGPSRKPTEPEGQ